MISKRSLLIALFVQSFVAGTASGHFGEHQHDQTKNEDSKSTTVKVYGPVAQQTNKNQVDENHDAADDNIPVMAKAFAPFKKLVTTRWDATHLFIESNGIPKHSMMVGIKNWQQQVPLPQAYTGRNAWQVPLHPKLADKPISAKHNLFRGAIAIAVNGVPIFNSLNNRGEDAFLIGELDKWGGHCGRGDDYHYHAAPIHLQEIAGKGNPIAYALDGFPIYGLTEPDGSQVRKLDKLNGHFDDDGNYHYHASKTYPYINGGMRGVVEVRGGQIEPQPRDQPVRPAQRPLRGAVITGFESLANNTYRLTYRLNSKSAEIEYAIKDNDQFEFVYKDVSGRSRTETYERRAGGQRRREPPPRGGRRRPPRRR